MVDLCLESLFQLKTIRQTSLHVWMFLLTFVNLIMKPLKRLGLLIEEPIARKSSRLVTPMNPISPQSQHLYDKNGVYYSPWIADEKPMLGRMPTLDLDQCSSDGNWRRDESRILRTIKFFAPSFTRFYRKQVKNYLFSEDDILEISSIHNSKDGDSGEVFNDGAGGTPDSTSSNSFLQDKPPIIERPWNSTPAHKLRPKRFSVPLNVMQGAKSMINARNKRFRIEGLSPPTPVGVNDDGSPLVIGGRHSARLARKVDTTAPPVVTANGTLMQPKNLIDAFEATSSDSE